MLLKLEDFSKQVAANPALKRGCIVDTNVLFAASFPLDTYNEWAEKVFQILAGLQIPVFTNINVRAEFIELSRRVLIPEGLIDFYEDLADDLDSTLAQSLKSLKTRKAKAIEQNKTFRLSEHEIKTFRKQLEDFRSPSGKGGWEIFCEEYYDLYIRNVWEEAVHDLQLQFLGTRAIESKKYFNSDPKWEDALKIMGKSGIGSADAMIVNLFFHSNLPVIVSTDSDVKKSILMMNPTEKYVLSPN
jgi:predicted nucleic acid-binding protein